MKVRRDLPHEVHAIENAWIPLADGSRLAARMWLPAGAHERPAPAVLEYIPYRKRDYTRERDEPMHRYFAGHGYAALRVDVRGTGDSDGVLCDEYLEREQDDALEVIRWIASQPWCSGAVGMMGKSWGGFNSLQVAARRPPELKAIIAVHSTDDRYADDAHYMGGCLLNENLTWGSILMSYSVLPPDPHIVGDRWKAMWLERLENSVCFPAIWLEHQHRDDYWKHGSVCEDYAAIQCPVYVVGGWADGYTNAVPRLLAGLIVPRKGLVGPWAHVYPHDGTPGPAIGFLQEALRWWDHWLKGTDTGIMDEPMYRVWMQDHVPPQPTYQERPGRWVAEKMWPSDRVVRTPFWLNQSGLTSAEEVSANLEVASPQTMGIAGGVWCAFGADGELPLDQREEYGKSLSLDSRPLDDRMEILGSPEVELAISVSEPVALLCVLLSDVAPDGAATRVSYGLLNLAHRDGHEEPVPLIPDDRYLVRLNLNHVGHAFPPGSQIRLSLATSYWPMVWPSPRPARLVLHTGASRLWLPVRPPDAKDRHLRDLGHPETAPPIDHSLLEPARSRRTIERDLEAHESVYTIYSEGKIGDAGVARVGDIDLDVGHSILKEFRINDTDPLSARARTVERSTLRREGWHIRVDTTTRFWSDNESFFVNACLDAYQDERRIFSRTWDREIRRELV